MVALTISPFLSYLKSKETAIVFHFTEYELNTKQAFDQIEN